MRKMGKACWLWDAALEAHVDEDVWCGLRRCAMWTSARETRASGRGRGSNAFGVDAGAAPASGRVTAFASAHDSADRAQVIEHLHFLGAAAQRLRFRIPLMPTTRQKPDRRVVVCKFVNALYSSSLLYR